MPDPSAGPVSGTRGGGMGCRGRSRGGHGCPPRGVPAADGRAEGLSEVTLHLMLTVAWGRFVDHRGPLLGHGTFNGGPVLRAGAVPEPEYRRLARPTTAAYVVDLLHHPNYGPFDYGPFDILAMEPMDDPASSDEAAIRQLLTDALSNEARAAAAALAAWGLPPRHGP